jgi:hypothetical protein
MVQVLSCPPRELPDYLAEKVVAFGKWKSKDQVLGTQHIWAIPLKTVFYVVDPESGLIVTVGRTQKEAEHGAKAYFEWKRAKAEASSQLAQRLKKLLDEFLAECRTKYQILSEDEKADIIENVVGEFSTRVRYRT